MSPAVLLRLASVQLSDREMFKLSSRADLYAVDQTHCTVGELYSCLGMTCVSGKLFELNFMVTSACS